MGAAEPRDVASRRTFQCDDFDAAVVQAVRVAAVKAALAKRRWLQGLGGVEVFEVGA